MIKIESSVKEIRRGITEVFEYLSDMKNLENQVPRDMIRNFSAETDSCNFQVDLIGDVNIRILEKIPHKTIRYSSDDKTGIPFNLWVQLKESQPGSTFMKLTFHAEVNMMMKMVLEPVMKSGIYTIADRITEVLNAQLKQEN